jgi:purine-binding chemotaxis protein CheW
MVEGVFSYRGQLVPLLDIRRRFRLGQRALHPSQHFIIAELSDRRVAIRVDGIERLAEIPEVDIEDARQAVPDAEYLAGVAKLRDGLVLIHDLTTFLSACEAADLDEKLVAAKAASDLGP